MARLRNPAPMVEKPLPVQKPVQRRKIIESRSESESELEVENDAEGDDGESLPDLDDLLFKKPVTKAKGGETEKEAEPEPPAPARKRENVRSRRRIIESSDEEDESEDSEEEKKKEKASRLVSKTKSLVKNTPKRKQRVLGPVTVNTTLLQKLSFEEAKSPEKLVRRKEGVRRQVLISRKIKVKAEESKSGRGEDRENPKIDVLKPADNFEETEEVEEEESIWCGSDASDAHNSENETEEEPKSRKPSIAPRKFSPTSRQQDARSKSRSLGKDARSTSGTPEMVIDLTASPLPVRKQVRATELTRPETISNTANRRYSSSSNDHNAMLQYSPPRIYSPHKKAPEQARPCTPPPVPPSPSKSRLQSPSKPKAHIPPTKHLRPSLDAFWSADVINTWNDTYSPSKPLLSPQKPKFLPTNDSADDSPTSSPKKRSPSKKPDPSIAAGRAARKAFEASKDALAHAFLTSLDTLTTSSRIAALTAPTGGTKIIWSKTLKTTAGRANWRRESFRTRTSDGIVETKYRNHASIELATKVIDNEDRLRNVIAHEFCHLATFMIDGQRGSPHGAEFKAWAQRVGRLFGDQGVEVTTKHSYVIEFKFVWECESCGYEFKRHSRSVDPMRHTCGKCRGRLVQTRPVPRGGGKGADREEGGAGGEYRVFVKENFGRVKKELEEKGAVAGMGKVMEVLGREYRERKAGDAAKSSDKTADENFRDVESAFEALTVAD